MTEELAGIAAESEIASILPDDDDILDGDTRSGSSFNSALSRTIQVMSVEQLAKALMPPYWSVARDLKLRQIARGIDYIGIGLYNAVTKVTGVIPYVMPSQGADDTIVESARVSTQLLHNAWLSNIPGMLFDVLSQDNGGVLEVIGGGGRSWEPLPPVDIGNGIVVPAIGLKVIDSQRAVRTGNPRWPIRVDWNDGNSYVMHHSRIIEFTQLPSTDPDLNGVGFCAISRVVNSMMQGGELDRILLDILSTGLTGEIILASPFESDDLETAYKKAAQRANDQQKPNTEKYVFVGVKNYEGKLQVVRIPLRRVPEGMTKQDMVAVLMQLMASSLSMDAREIFAAPISGNAKADATQHDKKTKSKFIREWITFMKQQLTFKFVPIGTTVEFDHIDPAELQEILEGRKLLAETHKIEMENGTMNVDTAIRQLEQYNFVTEDEAINIRENAIVPDAQVAISPESNPNTQRINNLFAPVQRAYSLVNKQDEEEYAKQLRELISDLKVGAISSDNFIVQVSSLNRLYVIENYLLGSQKTLSQLNIDDFETLEDFLDYLDTRLDGLTDFIDQEEDEEKIFKRAELWDNTILRTRYGSMLMREDQTQLLQWNLGVAEHCETCIGYSGQIRSIAEWRQLPAYPRCTVCGLKCTGINCKCFWTDA